jgi:hypothetical protein
LIDVSSYPPYQRGKSDLAIPALDTHQLFRTKSHVLFDSQIPAASLTSLEFHMLSPRSSSDSGSQLERGRFDLAGAVVNVSGSRFPLNQIHAVGANEILNDWTFVVADFL